MVFIPTFSTYYIFFVLSNLYTKQIFQQETQDDVDTGQVDSWKIIALTSFSIPFDCILSRNRINFKGPVSWGLFDFFRQDFSKCVFKYLGLHARSPDGQTDVHKINRGSHVLEFHTRTCEPRAGAFLQNYFSENQRIVSWDHNVVVVKNNSSSFLSCQ